MTDDLDLYALPDELTVEELPDASALSSYFSYSTASSTSCPLSSAATATSASSFG